MKKYILYCIIMLLAIAKAGAQDSYNDRVKKYIDQYYPLAIAEQKSSGIPASVTLGQAILETEPGTSELMTMANNHFGIKCKSDWTGDTFLHTDDAPDECFKKYKCAADSYRDHSAHLKKGPRYASLFSLSQTDYASWAIGLKRCGYATNSQYAQKLIKIIEDFRLQDYTYSALDTSLQSNYPTIPEVKQAAATMIVNAPCKADTIKKTKAITDTAQKKIAQAVLNPLKSMADSARKNVAHKDAITPYAKIDTVKKLHQEVVRGVDGKYDSGKVVIINGMKAFYALKGELLLQYAVRYKVRYPRLLEMNDLADAPLPFSMYVYLEKKFTSGTHAIHIVEEGENLLMISQEEGVQLKKLMALNYLNPHEEPATGAVLALQAPAAQKPDIKMNPLPTHKKNTISTGTDTTQSNDYIIVNKPKPVTETIAAAPAENKTEANEPVQYVAGSDYKGDLANVPPQSKQEDLASLKAELDKVVYADDSKLPQAKAAIPAPNKPVEAAAKQTEKKGEKYYKVKRGDTAFSIAKKNKITVSELMKWNHINADEIKVSQTLRVK